MRSRFAALSASLILAALGATMAIAQAPPPGAPAPSRTAEGAPIPADAAAALVRVLEDPEARDALIALLRQDPDLAGAAATAPEAAQPEAGSLAQRVGVYTKEAAETASEFVVQVVRSLSGLSGLMSDAGGAGLQRLGEALLRLAMVAGATIGALFLLRWSARPFYRSLDRRAARSGLVGRAITIVVALLVDAATVLLAWGGGYAFALLAVGDVGQMRLQSAYFLNAFLFVEAIKVGLRLLLAPRHAHLRVLPFSDLSANYWHFWAARLVGFAGYGILFFVPLVNTTVSVFVGRGLRVLVVLTAALMAVVVILQNKSSVARSIKEYGAGLSGLSARRGFYVLGSLWHILAILYVAALFVIAVSRPGRALEFMLGATVQSLLIVAAGMVVIAVISRAVTGGMRLPEDIRARLPLLEVQLNRFVPTILKVVRTTVLVAVVLGILQAWELVDVAGWMETDSGARFIAGLFGAILTILVALGIWLVVSSWIDYRLNPSFGTVPTARERTLLALFRNAALITVVVAGLMMALSELGVNIGPLLAGAGVVGLAIGFGAQKLVQDIITGVFIQFENAINEGDVVTVGGITGTVERLTIRSVGLRSVDGIYHIVPFSSVDAVSNFMRGFSYHVADIGVAYREDVKEVKRLMEVAFERLKEEQGVNLIGPMEMFGVQELGDSAVIVRSRLKTLPGKQWAVGRAYNERVKEVFDEGGVEIPYPHLTLYMGEDKAGNAPPLRIRRDRDPATGSAPRPDADAAAGGVTLASAAPDPA
ncbi:mechanosensitive ion channel domain-containing protein [Faunimonas sp. B44]|uniref:mechanosensitive ion channel domain-containing protein n=1 Tax=Faunimonas sp. B44 TaxID=3461493 RepID=UPI004044D830